MASGIWLCSVSRCPVASKCSLPRSRNPLTRKKPCPSFWPVGFVAQTYCPLESAHRSSSFRNPPSCPSRVGSNRNLPYPRHSASQIAPSLRLLPSVLLSPIVVPSQLPRNLGSFGRPSRHRYSPAPRGLGSKRKLARLPLPSAFCFAKCAVSSPPSRHPPWFRCYAENSHAT